MVFTNEQKIFINEAYFQNGVLENGKWVYHTSAFSNDFRRRFPNGFFVEVDFYQVLIIQLIQLFRESFDA
jgi:hypothetical protein